MSSITRISRPTLQRLFDREQVLRKLTGLPQISQQYFYRTAVEAVTEEPRYPIGSQMSTQQCVAG